MVPAGPLGRGVTPVRCRPSLSVAKCRTPNACFFFLHCCDFWSAADAKEVCVVSLQHACSNLHVVATRVAVSRKVTGGTD